MLTPREQGDFGEMSAMYWLASRGASVALPVGNNRHWDLIAELDGRLLRVQSRPRDVSNSLAGRSQLRRVAGTKVGTGSQSSLILRASTISSCWWGTAGVGSFRLIVLRALPPSCSVVRSTRSLRSNGASRFPAARLKEPPLQSPPEPPGGCPSGQRSVAVNHVAMRTQVRILLPPLLLMRR
jgi:hypothetical protein